MSKKRKHYEAHQKVAIIRKHLLENVPVSDLCDEHDIHPTQYYQWQKIFFENGEAAFQRKTQNKRNKPNQDQKRIEALEQKLQRRNEVVAELLEEHVQLKKEIGEL